MRDGNGKTLIKPIKILACLSILNVTLPMVDTQNVVKINNTAKAGNLIFEAQHGCFNGNSFVDKGDEKKVGVKEGDASAKIPNAEVIQDIYDYFHGEYGFSAEFIAGIVANWIKEAQLDPTANEPMRSGEKSAKEVTSGELGIGWGQWSFERHHALVDHAKSMDKDWWDPEAQLDYMVKADGMYVDILKDLALNSGDDPIEEAVNFHNQWERSADSKQTVIADRGQVAKDVLAYMKENGMDGAKEPDKIEKIKQGKNGKVSANSATSDTGEKVVEKLCAGMDDAIKSTDKIGISTKVNGENGQAISQNYEYKDLPEKYKKYIKLPRFDENYLKKPGNNFPQYGNTGQCTELIWAYMYQLWGKEPPQNGNGNVIWKAYKEKGAKITDKPTVGYGFSSNKPQANAGTEEFGHTGVVVGVMPDGKWIMANYNVPPKAAPSRTLYYTVVNGTDGNIKFFSGLKK